MAYIVPMHVKPKFTYLLKCFTETVNNKLDHEYRNWLLAGILLLAGIFMYGIE